MRACTNEPNGVVTTHLCYTTCKFSQPDCHQAFKQFIANGMLTLERAVDSDNPASYALYRVTPSVELAVSKSARTKSRRNVPLITKESELDRWLAATTGTVTIKPCS